MLEIRDLRYAADDKVIIDNVSLDIVSGDFVVITGPNGSGKSTLMKLIMGILQPTSGRIVFDKENITCKTVTERARLGIGFSFQQPVKIKGITVYQLIEIAAGNNLAPDEVANYIEMVGLESELYLKREIDNSLSGGELKRIELASVLARRAKLVIFDEPEAGIDLWGFDNLIRIFRKMRSSGQTTIVISHQEKILKIADKIILFENGKIKSKGLREQVLSTVLKEDTDGV